jgi:hypothetical protein
MTPELTRNGYLVDGELYPRVSSILATIAKPGIEGWHRRLGFEEADRIRDSSTAFGTLVHKACERVAGGSAVSDVARKLERAGDASAALCVEAFGRWLASTVARVVAVERTVWSERRRYAGTTDILVELMDGRYAVCDVKTSKSLSETYRLQLEAYRLALEEMGEPYSARLVIWLPSSHPGAFVEREYTDQATDNRAWRACLALYRFVQGCGEDWKADRALLEQITGEVAR